MSDQAKAEGLSFLAGSGEMAQRIRAHNWCDTSLGAPDQWPQALKTAVRIMLNTRHPIYIFWGEQSLCFYNDAYRQSIGSERHPASLGQPGQAVWEEIWEIIGPQIDQVLAGKGATWHENALVPITRDGVYEDVYWTYSYSPIDDQDAPNEVGGVLVICTETTKTVLAERSRAAEVERQRLIFQRMPGFVCILSGPDHTYEYVNEAYVSLTGPRDFIGRTVKQVFPELDGQGYNERLERVYRTGERFIARAIAVRLAGYDDERFIDLLYEPIRNPEGEITGIFVGGYDVTEQRRADLRRQALIRLTDDIRDLTDPDDIAFAAARVLGETLNVSRAGYGIIDTLNETVTIERDWNADGIKTLAGVLKFRDYGSYIEDLKRGETVVFADAYADPRAKDGADALKAISAQAVVNMPVTERGRFVALLYLNHATARQWPEEELALIREVAERTRTATERARISVELRKREEELRELNEQLEQRVAEALAEQRILGDIVESTDAFIQVVDMDFNWLAINRASAQEFERIFGVRPAAGGNMLEILQHLPGEQKAVKAVWSRALSGETFTEVDDFGDPDRDRRFYEMKFSPLFDEDCRQIGAYQFVFDVTQRILDEARLQQAEEQLRQAQKMEAVGQLTGGVAHDFNNMLAVVSGSLELLDRRAGMDDVRTKRLISSALEASKRAGNLTQRLLAFSRQQPLQPEVIEVNKLVSGMSDLFRHSLGADIQLETVLAGGVWRIHIDQNQLESVLLNLAVNARDAMPGGGHLTIETQNAYLDQRYVANEPGMIPGQYVMIAVTDTGTGMPPEVITKAFDPFFTTKAVGKGTGLGLSQVYGFVKQSGGHIKIYSEVGEGTTIKIYLPRYTGIVTATDETDNAAQLLTADSQELILVVDDEDIVRQFSVEALSDLGYRVVDAGSAQAALAILIERPDIDLLFTDIVMPEMNGRKLVDMVKERRPDLPVLYTTGYTRNAVVHNGVLDAGVELIGKPFTLEELSARVRSILDVAMLKKKRG